MLEIKGYVDHIIYSNRDNGYTVLVFVCEEILQEEEQFEEITVTGNFWSVSEGEDLLIRGEIVEHAVYGKQLSMKSYEVIKPESEEAIRRYLGSGAIKGVGNALAGRIVKAFGKDTFRVIEKEPERLSEVRGISESKALDIAEQVMDKTELRHAMIFLLQYGISNHLAVKIYKRYKGSLYKVIEENPYQMTEDIQGVGFKIADEIASKTGIRRDSEHRIKSGIVYVLMLAAQSGHTYLPEDMLVQKSKEILGVDEAVIDRSIVSLSIEKKIVLRNEKVFAYIYYYMEQVSAKLLTELDEACKNDSNDSNEYGFGDSQIELDECQRQAVIGASQHGVMVLTGGPGTGKTTTIKAIINYFESKNCSIELAAPTGRAAKRMGEAAGRSARTIHRLLEVGGNVEDDNEDLLSGMFGRDEDYPLQTDVVIIDEASMLDISLLFSLLKAIPYGTRLILVGDVNQLPSVGAGNVLKDIIESECFYVATLNKIFRQAEKSDIVVNAHKIQNETPIVLDNKSDDFFFLKRKEADETIKTLIPLVQTKIPKYVNANPFDIQVLTPTRKGLLGVERLNAILQMHLNPPSSNKREHTFGERIFREGDKIMQIKNNYQIPWEIRTKKGFLVDEGMGIFNGDMGIIKAVEEFSSKLLVEFDEERIVEYDFKQVDEIEHAYAITVHKSQGSEYPAVIIPLLNGPQMLMNRHLIYTAITRAKSCVIMVGDENVFYKMVANNHQLMRYSGLKESIQSYFEF